MLHRKNSLIAMSLGLLVLAGCTSEKGAASERTQMSRTEPAPLTALATLQPRSGGTAAGTVAFTQAGAVVAIVARVTGVTPGAHGFHLHETGDCRAPDLTSAGGHFNPTATSHGAPTGAEHHAGDFGNIEVGEDGAGQLERTSNLLSVAAGPNSVVGRAVILHEQADDLQTQPTGGSGSRIACGVVTLSGG